MLLWCLLAWGALKLESVTSYLGLCQSFVEGFSGWFSANFWLQNFTFGTPKMKIKQK
jgi:hypothetical protein